jgi:hypothetical protein
MKPTRTKTALSLGAVCIMTALGANAALVVYTPGDLLMGVRATGGTGASSTLVVNLGQASLYRDAEAAGVSSSSPMTVSVGNIGADLTATFGSGWSSRTDLQWGIAGTSSNTATVGGDPVGTVYLSRIQNTPGVPGVAPVIDSETTRLGVSTRMVGAAGIFDNYNQTANSTVAAIQGSSDANSWRSYMASGGTAPNTPGGTDFGSGYNIEATPSKTLGLYRLSTNDAGAYTGYFSINSSGTIAFVPEPTSALLLGLGGISLLARRRRQA